MRVIDGRMQEHFGFIDGFGNPDVDGGPGSTRPGRGKLLPNGQWAPLAPGEFFSDRGMRRAKPRRRRSRRSSFATARSWCIGNCIRTWPPFGGTCGTRRERLGISRRTSLGRRWSDDGRTVRRSELSTHLPTPRSLKIQLKTDLVYATDSEGARCPMGAHIRRANPRDALGFGGLLVDRRRIIRRGIPYGAYIFKRTRRAIALNTV